MGKSQCRLNSTADNRCPPSMSVLLIYIRQFILLAILRLLNPVLQLTYVTALSAMPSTIESGVLTPISTSRDMKVIRSKCDIIAIGDTLNRYNCIGIQLSTYGFLSTRASESGFWYSHWGRNMLTIVANDRLLNFSICYCRQIYCNLQLNCIAIYWMESIRHHSGHM